MLLLRIGDVRITGVRTLIESWLPSSLLIQVNFAPMRPGAFGTWHFIPFNP